MRVAQRELKVKVTADIDKSLTKLLDSLKKTVKVNVKVNVQGNELDKVKKTIDTLGKGKISSNVKVNVQSGELDKVQKDINKLGSSKTSANVDVKANSAGLDGLQKEMDGIERKAEEVSNARISPIGVAAGLAPLAVTLDQISDKILQISQQTIAPVFKDALDASRELYDQQTSFMKQFKADGISDNTINGWMKDIGNYAQESIFDTDQLMSLFGNFQGSGVDDAMGITKALAGITSMAPNVNTALDRVGRQFKQFTKDGNVYTRDWNAIRDAIGGVAANKLNDWFEKNRGISLVPESFQKGAVSVKDFIQATKEVGGSDMFQGLAKNTDTMSGALAQFRETLRNTLLGDQYDPGPLRSVFDGIVKGLNDVTDEIPNISKDIAKGLEFVKKTFGEAFKDFSVKDFFNGLRESFKGAAPVIQTIAKALGVLTNNGKDTGKVVGNLIKFAAGWKLFRGLAQPVFSLASAGRTLFDVARSMGAIKEGGFLGKLFGGMGAGSKGSKSFNAKAIKGQALNAAKNIAIIAGVIGTVWAGAKSLESISKMEIDWGSLASNLSATAVGLTAAGGYMALIGTALDKIKGLKKNLATGGAAVAGVAGVLVVSSKAIESVSQVKIDKNIGKNLAVMAGVITVAGGAMALIGTALTKFPAIAIGLAAGAAAVIGISAAMVLISKNMTSVAKNGVKLAKQLDKLSKIKLSDITEGFAKLAGIQTAMGALGVTQVATGAISAIGGLFSTLGNLAQTANIDSAMKLVKKISSAKLPDGKSLKKSMEGIKELLNSLSSFNVETAGTSAINGITAGLNVLGAIGNKAQEMNIDSAVSAIEKITNAKLPKVGDFKTKMEALKEIINELSSMNGSSLSEKLASGGESIVNLWADVSKAIDVEAITSVVDNVKGVVDALNKMDLGDTGVDGIKEKIKVVKTIVGELTSELGSSDNSILENIQEGTENWFSTANDALKNLDVEMISGVIKKTKAIIDNINKIELPEGGAGAIVKKISDVKKVIKSVMTAMQDLTGQGAKAGAEAGKKAGGFFGDIGEKIGGAIGGFFGGAADTAKNAKGSLDMSGVLSQIKSFVSIAKKINEIPAVDGVMERIKIIKKAISQILDSNFNPNDGGNSSARSGGGDGAGGTFAFSTIKTKVDDFVEIANSLNKIPTITEDLTTRIDQIKAAIDKLLGLTFENTAEDGGGIANLTTLVQAVNNALSQLQALTGQFQTTGISYAQALVNGFMSGGLERIPAKVNEIKSRIDSMADLTAIGKKMSDTLASGFDAKGLIKQINDIQAAIDSLKGKTVTITIKEVKQKAEEHTGGMIADRYNGGQIPEYHSTGGRVGERMKGKLSWFTGNRASGPSTDTVPAMLTPGEYVLKRSVANALGKGFLDALNTMNLNSAMAHLQNKVAGNVTNNTYNNITQNVDNKASYLNGLGSIRRVVRS